MRRLLFTAVAVLMLTAHGTTAQNDPAPSAGPHGTGGYSDIDMVWTADGRFCRRDGSEYPKRA